MHPWGEADGGGLVERVCVAVFVWCSCNLKVLITANESKSKKTRRSWLSR